jgi:hypothetical protein
MRRDARRVLEHFCDDAALVLPDGRSRLLAPRAALGMSLEALTRPPLLPIDS